MIPTGHNVLEKTYHEQKSYFHLLQIEQWWVLGGLIWIPVMSSIYYMSDLIDKCNILFKKTTVYIPGYPCSVS